MDTCKICSGDRTIVGETCFNCEGSALPIETDECGNRFINWREPKRDEYNLLVHYKMTTTDGLRKTIVKNGEIIHSNLPDEDMKKYQREIKEGVVRVAEYDVVADSLENAKREVINIAKGFNSIVVKVEERKYCGWGIK